MSAHAELSVWNVFLIDWTTEFVPSFWVVHHGGEDNTGRAHGSAIFVDQVAKADPIVLPFAKDARVTELVTKKLADFCVHAQMI